MASLTLQNVSKIYPNGFPSVKNVSLHIGDGELAAFYGPHGCGKSTILRMIGGLEELTSGRIYLGNTLLNDVDPRDRQLAMAFQNYRLYGHFNVFDNISLGLKIRSLPRNIIHARVEAAAAFLGISGILEKKIKNLSSVEKQCVAFARALACKPKVLLIDEEFAHQEDVLRERMLRDMVHINRKLGLTVLYVTNDHEEALTYGTKTVLMRDGRIEDILTQT